MSGDLVALYTDDVSSRVVLVGGPEDGTRISCTQDPPPMLLHMLVKENVSALLASVEEPGRPFPIADYQPVLDALGFFSRTDDGAYRYEYRGQR